MAAEDGDAGGPEAPAPEGSGSVHDRREGGDVEVGWTAAPERLDDGVELVPEVGQRDHEGSAADREGEELGVDPRQLGHELVSLGLDLHPGPQAEPGLAAEELDRGAAEPIRVGWGAHVGASRSKGGGRLPRRARPGGPGVPPIIPTPCDTPPRRGAALAALRAESSSNRRATACTPAYGVGGGRAGPWVGGPGMASRSVSTR